MHRVRGTDAIYSFAANNQPIISIKPGHSVIFETFDCFHGQVTSPQHTLAEVDFSRINPATGPVYVEGLKPGDTLKVQIERISVKEQAVTVAVPGLGLLKDLVPAPQTRIVQLQGNQAEFTPGFALQLKPMVGVIGVAPAQGQVPCGVPGAHGGNLDTKDIAPGSTLYLPVFVEGGLFALGDVHALQGDGEVCGTGFECSAEVEVILDVCRDMQITRPVLDSGDELMFIGVGENLEEAAADALQALIDYVKGVSRLTSEEAYMLASAACDLRICQVVNPLITVRAVLHKQLLATLPR